MQFNACVITEVEASWFGPSCVTSCKYMKVQVKSVLSWKPSICDRYVKEIMSLQDKTYEGLSHNLNINFLNIWARLNRTTQVFHFVVINYYSS